jgi:hypothetical protein
MWEKRAPIQRCAMCSGRISFMIHWIKTIPQWNAMKCDEWRWNAGSRGANPRNTEQTCVSCFHKLHNLLFRHVFRHRFRHLSLSHCSHCRALFRMKDTDLMLYSVMLFVTWLRQLRRTLRRTRCMRMIPWWSHGSWELLGKLYCYDMDIAVVELWATACMLHTRLPFHRKPDRICRRNENRNREIFVRNKILNRT